MTHSKIIPTFQELYNELLKTDPVVLLSVNEPALKFVFSECFELTRYAQYVCGATSNIASCCQTQVTKLLQMILPKLAAGLQKQNSFEECDESFEKSFANMLVRNLVAECSVGFVNYE